MRDHDQKVTPIFSPYSDNINKGTRHIIKKCGATRKNSMPIQYETLTIPKGTRYMMERLFESEHCKYMI